MSKLADRVYKIIKDEKIHVQLTATKGMFDTDGGLLVGGAFMGNTIQKRRNTEGKFEKFKITAHQEVNPEVLAKMDENEYGTGIMHELTEAYEGGLISWELNTSAQKGGPNNLIYQQAHDRATKQPEFLEEYYNEAGKVVDKYDESRRHIRVYKKGPGGWSNPILYY